MPSTTALFLITGKEGYGVLRGVMSLAGRLGERGCETRFVAVTEGSTTQALRSEGRRLDVLGPDPLPFVGGSLITRLIQFVEQSRQVNRLAKELRTLLTEDPPDFIHVRTPALVGIAGKAARRQRIAVFWHMPNAISDRYPLQLNKRAYQHQVRSLNIIPIANSRYTAQTIASRSIQPHIMYVGTDERRFDPDAVAEPVRRSELGIPDDASVFAIASRFIAYKGQQRFVEAVGKLGAAAHDVHVLLLGGPIDDDFARSIHDTAARHAMTDRLHMPGPVADVERYYDCIDVAVNSRLDAEPFGQSVIEAMMMRRPVLAHALGGPGETIVDGRTGWLMHEPSVEAFQAGIQRALDDRPRWTEMGEAAREHALANFTLTRQVDQYCAIISQYIGAASKPS